VALRQEDLLVEEAIIYRFPTAPARARAAHRRVTARRRRVLGVGVVGIAGFLLAQGPLLLP
jgi:hypothetical protein